MGKKLSSVYMDSVFLNKYLGKVSDLFISVYLCAKGLDTLNSEEIAECLAVDDVYAERALKFWIEKGELAQQKEKKKVCFDEKPVYYMEELKIYSDKNEYIKKMFDSAQQHLGRLLTHSDLSAVFSFHHWLGLEADTVDLLLQYCAEKGHKNMRYIERVAIDWAENEIITREQAEERIKLYNNDFRCIMRAMGQSGRNPVAAEEKHMKKWVEEMKMPLELIEFACEKTVMNTGKASFGYADKILSDWKNKNFATVEDVKKAEMEYAQGKTEEKQAKPVQKKNAFLNYEQRTYDFDELKRLEREKNRKENL